MSSTTASAPGQPYDEERRLAKLARLRGTGRRRRQPRPQALTSPPPPDEAFSPPPPSDGYLQLALKGEVRPFVTPDHSWGESFPGKQPPTQQLSLFEAGVKKKPAKKARV